MLFGVPHEMHYWIDANIENTDWQIAVVTTDNSCLVSAPITREEYEADPDDATIAFLSGAVPEVLAGLALAGVLAAVMSTADSFLNIGSAALVRDLPRALAFYEDVMGFTLAIDQGWAKILRIARAAGKPHRAVEPENRGRNRSADDDRDQRRQLGRRNAGRSIRQQGHPASG